MIIFYLPISTSLLLREYKVKEADLSRPGSSKVLCIVLLQYSGVNAFQRHRSLHVMTEVRIGLQPLNAHRLPGSSFDRDESKSEMIWNTNAAKHVLIECPLSLIHL